MTSLSPKGIISFTLTWGVLGPLALSVTKVQHFKECFSVVGRSRTQKDLLFLTWSQKGVGGVTTLLRYFDRLSNRRLSNRDPLLSAVPEPVKGV